NLIVAVGDNARRAAKTRMMQEFGFQATTVVHPFSSIGHATTLGQGVLVCAGAIIDPDVFIDDGVVVNVGALVGHESRIGAFSHICGGALIGANCIVGALTFVGMGANIISGLTIGRNAFIAAGALVTKHVPDGVLALGAPARFRQRQPA